MKVVIRKGKLLEVCVRLPHHLTALPPNSSEISLDIRSAVDVVRGSAKTFVPFFCIDAIELAN